MKYYLLTWKALKEQKPLSHRYMVFLTKCITDHKQICLLDNAFEYDKSGKLHFHCIVATRYVRFKKYSDYCFENDMYFNFTEVKEQDLPIVQQYLRKQHTADYIFKLEQKECADYFESGYHFVEEAIPPNAS